MFMAQTYRVGQDLAGRSEAEEIGCGVIFVALQDTRFISAFSLIFDICRADFPPGAV